MENQKDTAFMLNSIRGLKRTYLKDKEFSKNKKNFLEEKFNLKTQFRSLSKLLEINNYSNQLNNKNNDNKSNSNTFTEPNSSKTNYSIKVNLDNNINNDSGNNNNNNFLVSHKVIFQSYRLYEDSKFSSKSYGNIISYGVNNFQGIIRNYNEDRVSILLNVIKPPSRKNENWPKVSFFAIFDGHGGTKCADFLKENLHHYIFREPCFPADPKHAILKGFEQAETIFIQNTRPKNILSNFENSGSCGIVVIIMDDNCYIANVGDSRAIYSENKSSEISLLSLDHKPNDPNEKKRITAGGGYIYQGIQNYQNYGNLPALDLPWRIFPGRLSVSRAFGDIEAKLPELGGNPKVLICQPQILSFKLNEFSDFIILGSDGIFDKLTNKQIVDSVWACACEDIKASNIFEQSGKITDMIMKQSLFAGSIDNISCIFICFKNFNNILKNKFYSDESVCNTTNVNKSTTDDKKKFPYDIKEEYKNSTSKDVINSINYDEIRKKVADMSDANIQLKKNEFIKLNSYSSNLEDISSNNSSTSNEEILDQKKKKNKDDIQIRDFNSKNTTKNIHPNHNVTFFKNGISMDEKPKTSSEFKKLSKLGLQRGLTDTQVNEGEFSSNTKLKTEGNCYELDKALFKKIGIMGESSQNKNYELTLPSFKISKKLDKRPKGISLKNLSPINYLNGMIGNSKTTKNLHGNVNDVHMNFTLKHDNKFLPNINNHVKYHNNMNKNLKSREKTSTYGFK